MIEIYDDIKEVIILKDYTEQTTEELLNLLITLSKVHQGLYGFELKGYEERLNQIKDIILSRVKS